MKMYQLLVSGEVNHYEIEKRYIAKSGDTVWAQLNISSVRDEQQNFLYAIAHNLDITERKKSEIVLFERSEEESVFANLLKFSFLPIDEYMNLSLEEILSVSWIKIECKGAIFLTKGQGESDTLQLVANIRMPDELLRLCSNVEYGTYLCGRAAESMQVQFADCVDERHETRYQGVVAYGHYDVPIVNDGKVLGVIVLYLAAGHQSQQKEINFLKHVADVLSLGIARKYAEEKINYQAAHDSLTGLISRREFESRLMNVLALSDSSSEHALCYLDLDQFKVINDDCGHLAGDELLHQLAILLQSKVRKRDTLARLGGDEFGLLMEHCSIEEAMRVAESLRLAVEEFRFVWEKKNFSLGVSIGLVPIISGKSDVKGILGAADAACYAAKDAGRNRIHIYNPEDVDLAQRRGEMKWVTKIKDAIDEDRMRLYVQPIVPLLDKGKQKNFRHYECLIRMIDEDGKVVPPGAFLPAAERYDLSVRIDQWVFDAAYAWLEERPGKSKGLTSCSVNLSGHSLGNDEFLKYIVEKLEKGTVLPSSICFEITETVAISKLSNATRFMEVLKGIGCYFALDDFGSGVSSFGYLKNLDVDFLKIDGMFIRDMVNDPIDLEMVRSINEIGHVMGKKTIAEFVENKETLACLKKLGVDYAQGFHVGKPRAVKVPVIKVSKPGTRKKKARTKPRVVRTRKTD
jgi:diguanylate cyclase (GGDEF)-like protein